MMFCFILMIILFLMMMIIIMAIVELAFLYWLAETDRVKIGR